MAQFGTDGFRGRAESFSKHGLMKIGEKLAKTGLNGKIVIGRDTRESSDEFYEAIVSGINSVGHNVIDLGVVTTPCVSYFSRVIADAKYGIMITASHNPYYDNGIKIFEHGNKIDEKLEKKLFDAYSLERQETRDKRIEIKDKRVETRDCSSYLKYVSRGLDLNRVSDKKIVVDLANGSASFLAKKIFGSDNFKFISDLPNGTNINENCGIIFPKNLERKVLESNAYLGISYDGDCDRVGFCDEIGNSIDGDYVLGFIACDMLLKGELENKTLVVTEYSNLALDNYLESLGAKVVRVKNGDKNVFKMMKEGNYNFGGEKLGHIIFGREYGTGDGFFATKEVLSRLDYSKSASSQMKLFELNSQIILNVPVKNKIPFLEIDGFEGTVDRVKKGLNGSGRVLVRYSGTEDVCRIMLEGKRGKDVLLQMGEDISKKLEKSGEHRT